MDIIRSIQAENREKQQNAEGGQGGAQPLAALQGEDEGTSAVGLANLFLIGAAKKDAAGVIDKVRSSCMLRPSPAAA
jgi:hypothetical protein